MAVVSELLCFLFNKYGQCPQTNLRSLLVDFYDEAEVMTAKELLHNELREDKFWITSSRSP